jgi:VWFA-related protein
MKTNFLSAMLILLIGICFSAIAQTPTPTPEKTPAPTNSEDEVITVETNVVNIPVTVFDRGGKFVSDLKKEDFQIFEDGVEQQIEYFATVEQPFMVALVLDMSGSAQAKMGEIQTAANAFVTQLRPQDRGVIVSFNEGLSLLCEPTNDKKKLSEAIYKAPKLGGTSLYSAVDATLKYLNHFKGRRAMVLFSDGVDTTSKKISRSDNLDLAKESETVIYVVQYDTYRPPTESEMSEGERRYQTGSAENSGFAGGRKLDYERATIYLQNLADYSGGRIFQGRDLNSIIMAYSKIILELSNNYSLGYSPKEDAKKGQRKIKVKVNREKVAIRAKNSYIAKEEKKSQAEKQK